MRDKTKEAMRMFLGGRCYTAENLERDYLAEVAGYSDDRWEAPQRAARLAAAVKRYKTSEMLRFIFATVAHDPDPDLTPLTVKRLCNALFGRTTVKPNPGTGRCRHKKTRLVRSGFHVLPRMGAGTTKTIDVRVAAVTGNVRAISGVPALYGANG